MVDRMKSGSMAMLQAEVARLISLLEANGIEWRLPAVSSCAPAIPAEVESSPLGTGEKVALFRRLFRGRVDTYSVRWASKATGKSGYSPA